MQKVMEQNQVNAEARK
jgi:spore maturation protein CgeB